MKRDPEIDKYFKYPALVLYPVYEKVKAKLRQRGKWEAGEGLDILKEDLPLQWRLSNYVRESVVEDFVAEFCLGEDHFKATYPKGVRKNFMYFRDILPLKEVKQIAKNVNKGLVCLRASVNFSYNTRWGYGMFMKYTNWKVMEYLYSNEIANFSEKDIPEIFKIFPESENFIHKTLISLTKSGKSPAALLKVSKKNEPLLFRINPAGGAFQAWDLADRHSGSKIKPIEAYFNQKLLE